MRWPRNRLPPEPARLRALAAGARLDRGAWIERDRLWAARINRAADQPLLLALLGPVSRLGDGVLWYSIMLALPFIDGRAGRLCATHMAIAGLLCVSLYWLVKRWAARERPYTCCEGIRLCSRPLDRFSFPSGHTLHAVAFSAVIVAHYPSAGWLLWPFTALVALSRVALGLHYPSDVLAGAAIGASVATLVLMFAL